jgi:redox-sensitive bicupin YhaK (pirin superfamily)
MIIARAPLAMHWPTLDPFLFCAHHDDHYPRGNGRFGPAAPLSGRQMGSDFSQRDGWSMYHGQQVPGFPAHPHRGFETVTLVRRGRIDHADSLGAAARFGDGDVQWLTAGRGIVHSEMFPLLRDDADNPLELFQIWLNLPSRSKMCAPYFSMLWAEDVPRVQLGAPGEPATELVLVAGRLQGLQGLQDSADALQPLPPPPDSWASAADADVGIFTLRLPPQARFTLPAAAGEGTLRVAYFFAGDALVAAGERVDTHLALQVDARAPLVLHNPGSAPAELLVLQGRPIGEPVAQHGPFVMNTEQQIREAFADYQRTRFGGWPWPDEAPVHGSDATRFAQPPGGPAQRRG